MLPGTTTGQGFINSIVNAGHYQPRTGYLTGLAHKHYLGVQRRLRYPGVATIPQPARGRIVCPAPADITDESTITVDSGAGAWTFGFDTVGDGMAGADTVVDISGAATAEDVATAFFAAFEADWLADSIEIEPHLLPDGVTLALIQGGQPGWWQGGFDIYGRFGNNPINESHPGEFTVEGMDGGRNTLPGRLAQIVCTGFRRVIPLGPVIPENDDPLGE